MEIAQKLEEKILKIFEKAIYIIKGKTRIGSLVHHSIFSVDEAIRQADNSKSEYKNKVRDTALFLRKLIIKEDKRELLD